MKSFFSTLILIGAIGVLGYYGYSQIKGILPTNSRQTAEQTQQTTRQTEQTPWETKTDDQANVTVKATPVELSNQSPEWKFDITFDTHSVELDQDLVQIAALVDNQGTRYNPVRWEGPTGGHHREGVLVFNRISPTPRSITLAMNGVGGVARDFAWQLTK